LCALGAQNEAGIGKTGMAIRLTEPDAPPIFAHVLPLTGSDFRTRLQPAAVAAVFIGAPPDAQDGADALAAAFGLTPAETRLFASQFGGRTLIETAATLEITRPTAKTHLEHIFLKTGVTRQVELMRLCLPDGNRRTYRDDSPSAWARTHFIDVSSLRCSGAATNRGGRRIGGVFPAGRARIARLFSG
jgi:DNA-binding CsgD family transcriptional regulator